MTADPAVFHQAAERILTGGHTKGTFKENGRYCIVGALLPGGVRRNLALYPRQEEVQLLAELLGIPATLRCIIQWNDARERTAEDVLTLLEQAAEKAEANLL